MKTKQVTVTLTKEQVYLIQEALTRMNHAMCESIAKSGGEWSKTEKILDLWELFQKAVTDSTTEEISVANP